MNSLQEVQKKPRNQHNTVEPKTYSPSVQDTSEPSIFPGHKLYSISAPGGKLMSLCKCSTTSENVDPQLPPNKESGATAGDSSEDEVFLSSTASSKMKIMPKKLNENIQQEKKKGTSATHLSEDEVSHSRTTYISSKTTSTPEKVDENIQQEKETGTSTIHPSKNKVSRGRITSPKILTTTKKMYKTIPEEKHKITSTTHYFEDEGSLSSSTLPKVKTTTENVDENEKEKGTSDYLKDEDFLTTLQQMKTTFNYDST